MSSGYARQESNAAMHLRPIASQGLRGQCMTYVATYCMDCHACTQLAEAGASITAFGVANGIFLNLCNDSCVKWAPIDVEILHDRSWLSGKGSPTTTCSEEESREGSSRDIKICTLIETKQQTKKKRKNSERHWCGHWW